MPRGIDDGFDYEESEENSNRSYIAYYDHYCIYRCIVKNVKN